MTTRTYQPILTVKPIADELWIVDGPCISFYGFHFPTRMTICRLNDHSLWIHSPTVFTPALAETISILGQVKHIVAPNSIHYWHMPDWQQEFPDALVYADTQTQNRAKKFKRPFTAHHTVSEVASFMWQPTITGWPLTPEQFISETLFFHHPSDTLLVTDFFENFNANKLPFFERLIARVGGALAPQGGTTYDQRWFYRPYRQRLKTVFAEIHHLAPARIIPTHGDIIETDATTYIQRATTWI